MTSLDRVVVLVAGGAGAVGSGIVGALLDAGATVAVPSRMAGRLDALRERVGGADRLLGVVGDVAGAEDAGRVRDEIVATVGPPTAVVAAVGGWSSGPKLADIALDDWDAILARNLRTHQVVASTYIPLLRGRPGASYLVIVGDTAWAPAAGAGPVSVTAAAELMAARVLGLEESEAGIQVTALVLGPVRIRDRPAGPQQSLTAHDVGKEVTRRVAAGLTRAGAGEAEVVGLPATRTGSAG
ncbi:MAG: SDR family oxidoreductase [Actinomycetota bacterium]|nr:SDR family oxidoreductase [Actinomycetota bacterium]